MYNYVRAVLIQNAIYVEEIKQVMQCVMCSQLSCHGDVLVFAVLVSTTLSIFHGLEVKGLHSE